MVITEFKSVRIPYGTRRELTWEDFTKKLSTAKVTDEAITEYAAMTNEERTAIKDVGGYVGGTFENNYRSATTVEERCLVVIDADDYTELPSCITDWRHGDIAWYAHTTHTHLVYNNKPRLRWIFPLSRTIDSGEYAQVAKVLASWVGGADKSTDQAERLMFWPSVSFDGEFRYWMHDGEFLDPDTILSEPIEEEEKVSVPAQTSVMEPIGEGGRNSGVFAYGASLRSAGVDDDILYDALVRFNDERCSPPLPDRELHTIYNSLLKYPKGDKLDAIINSMRSASDDFSDIGGLKKLKPPTVVLEYEDCASLDAREIEKRPDIVEGLISEGCAVLSAPPKTGKSFFCMDMAISVATGTDFLGRKTRKGSVIYLALEDGDRRLQDRSRKVSGLRGAPPNLYFVKVAPTLGNGLLKQLKDMKDKIEKETGEPVILIIIDVFQLVRDAPKKNQGVYAQDYVDVHEFHNFGLDESCANVLVHHNNKGNDNDDFMNNISGSAGIAGAADAFIVLKRKRNEDTATMGISGRDCDENIYTTRMNWSTYRWEMLGSERDTRALEEKSEYDKDPVVRLIRDHLDAAADGSDEEYVTVSLSPGEMLEIVKSGYGGAIPTTENKLRTLITGYEEKFMKYDGIKSGFSDGCYKFTRRTEEEC